MVLKALVESILQSYREPNNLLHIQLLQTLKRDVAQDVTDAFMLSQPLVNKHPDLYRNSTSFLDFLFKLCDAPRPPKVPCAPTTPCIDNTEWLQLKSRLETDLEHQQTELKDMTQQVSVYKNKLELKDTELNQTHQLLTVKDSHNRELLEQIEKLRPVSETAQLTLDPAIEAGEVKALRDELVQLMVEFKRDVTDQFGLTLEYQTKLDNLLPRLRSEMEPLALSFKPESVLTTEEISEATCQKIKDFLTEKVSLQQVKELMNLSHLDEDFKDLIEKIQFIAPNRQTLDKIKDIVQTTQSHLTKVFENIFKKISMLHGKDLTSPLHLLEKIDELQNTLHEKEFELAKDPSQTIRDYCTRHHPEFFNSSEPYDQKFIDMVNDQKSKLSVTEHQVAVLRHYFPELTVCNLSSTLQIVIVKLQQIYVRMANIMSISNMDLPQLLNSEIDMNFFKRYEDTVAQFNAERREIECSNNVPLAIKECEDWEGKYTQLKSIYDVVKVHCFTLFGFFNIQMDRDFSDTDKNWSSEIINQTRNDRDKLNELKAHTSIELQEKVQIITELQAKVSSIEDYARKLESKYEQDQREWEEKWLKRYNECTVALRREKEKLHCGEAPKINTMKRRKISKEPQDLPTTPTSSHYLKALFECLFEKYFVLLSNSMENVDFPEQLRTKLDILNALVNTMRPNDLLTVLIQYVEYDLSVPLEENKIVLSNLIERVKSHKTVQDLLNSCMKQTTEKINKIVGPKENCIIEDVTSEEMAVGGS